MSLPEIDPVAPKKIISKRVELGSFSTVNNLLLVPEIRAKTVEKILEFIEI